jgi:hypothetical protein
MASTTSSSRGKVGSFLILVGFVLLLIQAFLTPVFILWPYVVGSLAVIAGCSFRLEEALANLSSAKRREQQTSKHESTAPKSSTDSLKGLL